MARMSYKALAVIRERFEEVYGPRGFDLQRSGPENHTTAAYLDVRTQHNFEGWMEAFQLMVGAYGEDEALRMVREKAAA